MPAIAYLTNLFPSPVEPYVIDEIDELRQRGINVVACSVRRPRAGLKPELKALSFQSLYFRPLQLMAVLSAMWLGVVKLGAIADFLNHFLFRGPEPWPRRIRAVAHLLLGIYYAALLKDRNVAHIHVHHGYFGSCVAMVAARMLGIGFSMTLHGSDLLLDPVFLDLKLSKCDFCITISDYNRRYILKSYPGVAPKKILLRRMGVRDPGLGVIEREPHPVFAILAVGRLHPVKDYPFLIEACWLLKCCGLQYTCRIAGDGPEFRRLEEMIRAFDLGNQVRLLGEISRDVLDDEYAKADLIALTSRSEGIPLALMEAMVRGKPVLAPEITGIPELVIHGRTGFLYPSGSREKFVAQVASLIRGRYDLGPITRTARAHVLTHFHRETNLAALCDLFLPYVQAPNRPPSRVPALVPGASYEDTVLQ